MKDSKLVEKKCPNCGAKLSFKLEDKESVSSTESIPIRLDESILFKSLSFISFADIRLILKNKINAKISVKCILFDIFTPPF